MLVNIALLHEAAQEYDDAITMMNSAHKLDPDNQKIKLKIRQLEEMMNSKLQGNQLSPLGEQDMFPRETESTPTGAQRDILTESQQIVKDHM